jgi:hypothetical protein
VLAYDYKGFTVHAWTEWHGPDVRGLATITGRRLDGRMMASSYLCPLHCGDEQACLVRMREDINAALDRGTLPGSGGAS